MRAHGKGSEGSEKKGGAAKNKLGCEKKGGAPHLPFFKKGVHAPQAAPLNMPMFFSEGIFITEEERNN